MTPAERVDHLAHLLRTLEGAAPAGRVAQVIGTVAREIGATGAERARAAEIAAGAAPPAYPARHSDRVRVVEDMLLVALADGTLSPTERKGIIAAQHAVGIDPAAWSRILDESRARLVALAAAPAPAGVASAAAPAPVRECSALRAGAPCGDSYCHFGRVATANVFGCGELGLEWSGLAGWFAFGAFDERGAFRFDRARILAELARREEAASACPHYDPALARAAVAALPEAVKPGETDGWEYRRTFVARPGVFEHTETVKIGSIEEERRLFADGIAPVSLAPAQAVVDAARDAVGRPRVSLG